MLGLEGRGSTVGLAFVTGFNGFEWLTGGGVVVGCLGRIRLTLLCFVRGACSGTGGTAFGLTLSLTLVFPLRRVFDFPSRSTIGFLPCVMIMSSSSVDEGQESPKMEE